MAALLYLPLYGFLPLLLVAAVQGVASSALNPLIDSLALALARERRMEYGPVRVGRLDRLHGGERRRGLAAVRHRHLAGAVAAGGSVRRGAPCDAVAAGGRARPGGAARFAGLRLLAQPAVPPGGAGEAR